MSSSGSPLGPSEPLAATLVAESVTRALGESGIRADHEPGATVHFGGVAAPALLPGGLLHDGTLLAVAKGELRFQVRDSRVVPELKLWWRPELRLRQLFWPIVVGLPIFLAGDLGRAALAAVAVFAVLGTAETCLTLVRTPRYVRRLVAAEIDLLEFRQAHGVPMPETGPSNQRLQRPGAGGTDGRVTPGV